MQLLLALDVEGEDACVQRRRHLRLGFSYPCEDDPVSGESGRETPVELTQAYDIRSSTEAQQTPEKLEIRVRLHRVGQEKVDPIERPFKAPVPRLHHVRIVDVQRGAELHSQLRDPVRAGPKLAVDAGERPAHGTRNGPELSRLEPKPPPFWRHRHRRYTSMAPSRI